MKVDKKGGRAALKPENGADGASVKSASDGEAQSVRSVRSAPSPDSNRSVYILMIFNSTFVSKKIKKTYLLVHL